MADGFNEPGIDGNTFIDGKALVFKLTEDILVDLIHGIF